MLIAAVHPVRVSYVYRLATLSIFQFFYWTISPVMSDCLLQISHGFYYVRVVCPWFIAPYLLQSLQFVIATFSVYHLSNYFPTFICRVTRFFKKSLSESRLTQRYAPDTVDIYRYMPFALPDTVTDTINLFAVFLSLDFTCLGKNNLTSDIVYMLPFYALIQWRFNLCTAHHAVMCSKLLFVVRHG